MQTVARNSDFSEQCQNLIDLKKRCSSVNLDEHNLRCKNVSVLLIFKSVNYSYQAAPDNRIYKEISATG